jgi:hypothetical protein
MGWEYFQHSGGMNGFAAFVVFIPKLKFGLVAFSNDYNNTIEPAAALLWKLVYDKFDIPTNFRHNEKM